MNPGQNPRPVSEVSGFAEVLLSRDGSELSILVGGHAVKHVKMMILCVFAFIKNLLANIEREQYSERMVVNILVEEPSRNKAKALI